jgi:membrane fusion protein
MTHEQSLFRQEAIEFERQHRRWGEVSLLQPLSIKLTVWFIAVAVALVMPFLSLAQFAKKETVVGYLTSTAGTVKVFASRQGIIKTIYVDEGEQIQEGQPILTILTDKITDDGKDVDEVVLDSLAQQRDFLIQHIAAEEERIASEQQRLTAQIRGLETEISQLEARIAIQSKRVQLSESFVSTGARLSENNNISEYEYKNRLERYLEKQQALESLSQEKTQRQIQISDSRYLLVLRPLDIAAEIQVFRNKLLETEQRIAEISGRRAYTLLAPIAGQVSTLQAVVGQVADPQRPQLSILPVESVLQAELFVPTRAIGFVQSGQEVRILYEAFPYQQFGTYGGRISKLTRTILTGSDVSAPVTLKEPAYKVTVALDRPDIDAYGQKIPLQEDMLLKADIILDKRSLLKWVLDPLFSVRM